MPNCEEVYTGQRFSYNYFFDIQYVKTKYLRDCITMFKFNISMVRFVSSGTSNLQFS